LDMHNMAKKWKKKQRNRGRGEGVKEGEQKERGSPKEKK
jgi:hypothetical protein